ncbi:hypothetical protein BIFGAL_03671 [Bifidobacterium gallicum DSM 20093 = LMG 11596]|uniref:Uncharacterized protein n=1 Tax=Bifidobacterium gallicum DSM 20093 = LMG 11596 TaxID=561180 RepID=D1NUZ3_9BIFI|nr:hypothetical protein BIFGAL_03671 [Bifidobacterium gallicum DSM 20093 = LMG 11596]
MSKDRKYVQQKLNREGRGNSWTPVQLHDMAIMSIMPIVSIA